MPFVQATVVRARRPASVRPGATALVLGDGTIEGFVGGHCAEPSVRMHALRALETGEALLLRIEPGNGEADAIEGAITVHNPCISGGALEIFLEPRVPAARVHVVGDTPIALRAAELARTVGYDVAPHAGGELGSRATTPRSSSPRTGATRSARWPRRSTPACRTSASWRAGSAARRWRRPRVTEDDRARLHTPAGLDIGARTPEEIALSILAEIVAARARACRRHRVGAPRTNHEGHCCHE